MQLDSDENEDNIIIKMKSKAKFVLHYHHVKIVQFLASVYLQNINFIVLLIAH